MPIQSKITTAVLLVLAAFAPIPAAHAQTRAESPKTSPPRPESASWPIHTYYLKTDSQVNMNDIATILRNAIGPVPGSAIVPYIAQKAIVVREDPADIPFVEKILADIDRPTKSYRVIYTVSEMDSKKLIGTQHFAMVMVSGQQTKFKQGSKIPIVTGSFGSRGELGVQSQFTYADVGLTVVATLEDVGSGGTLRYEINQASAVAPEPSASGSQQPTMRDTSLTGQASLTPGKPLMLGSIDFPGSTRRLDVEALMEPLP